MNRHPARLAILVILTAAMTACGGGGGGGGGGSSGGGGQPPRTAPDLGGSLGGKLAGIRPCAGRRHGNVGGHAQPDAGRCHGSGIPARRRGLHGWFGAGQGGQDGDDRHAEPDALPAEQLEAHRLEHRQCQRDRQLDSEREQSAGHVHRRAHCRAGRAANQVPFAARGGAGHDRHRRRFGLRPVASQQLAVLQQRRPRRIARCDRHGAVRASARHDGYGARGAAHSGQPGLEPTSVQRGRHGTRSARG